MKQAQILQALAILTAAQESPHGIIVVCHSPGNNTASPALRVKQLLYTIRQQYTNGEFDNLQFGVDKEAPETKVRIIKLANSTT